jgi:Rho termination factor, N-terminal domain
LRPLEGHGFDHGIAPGFLAPFGVRWGKVGSTGGKGGSYQDWSKDELMKKAGQIGIKGRSKMNKGELIDALRNH